MKKTAIVAMMVVIALVGTMAYAFADASPVTVSATAQVKAKLDMTAPTGTHDMALEFPGLDIDPEETIESYDFHVNVKSNKAYNIGADWASPTDPNAAYGFVFTDVPAAGKTTGTGFDHDASITFTPNWDLDPDATYTAALVFTAAQN